ncbi:hypothetical protein TeGR_g3216 [Tetraparma gracilis]|uniref:NAD(P)-binding domain-containing protein n=1 Tax=Tetraparma gracilis TaxID=2962635 RepID=A0ABQ6N0R9_9STRA|nr:hypothetical protein TeGR_g3216 [Tetraparma gracilis]
MPTLLAFPLAALLLMLLLLPPCSPFAPPPPSPVLVTGATGKVGRLIVEELLLRNIPVRALARDVDRARHVLHPLDPFSSDPSRAANLHIVKGDVTDRASLEDAVDGASAVIAAHGTLRLSRLHQALLPLYWPALSPARFARRDMAHPYHVNYRAVEALGELCAKHGVGKIVRLTGLTCSLRPWNPVSVIFNALLSFSGRYHKMGEAALLAGPTPVTLLRPGGLSDVPRDPSLASVQVALAGSLPPPARVPRADVALAAVESALHPELRGESYACAIRSAGDVGGRRQGERGEGRGTALEALLEELPNRELPGRYNAGRENLMISACHGLFVWTLLLAVGKGAKVAVGLAARVVARFAI